MASVYTPGTNSPQGWPCTASSFHKNLSLRAANTVHGESSASCCPSMDTVEPWVEEEEASLAADWGVRIQIWEFQTLDEATVLS